MSHTRPKMDDGTFGTFYSIRKWTKLTTDQKSGTQVDGFWVQVSGTRTSRTGTKNQSNIEFRLALKKSRTDFLELKDVPLEFWSTTIWFLTLDGTQIFDNECDSHLAILPRITTFQSFWNWPKINCEMWRCCAILLLKMANCGR